MPDKFAAQGDVSCYEPFRKRTSYSIQKKRENSQPGNSVCKGVTLIQARHSSHAKTLRRNFCTAFKSRQGRTRCSVYNRPTPNSLLTSPNIQTEYLSMDETKEPEDETLEYRRSFLGWIVKTGSFNSPVPLSRPSARILTPFHQAGVPHTSGGTCRDKLFGAQGEAHR
jgi:hypothetical protein